MYDPTSFRPALADLPSEATFQRDLRRVTAGPVVVLGFAVLVLLGLIFFLLHSAREVERLDQRLGDVVTLEKLAVDMETGVRGFEISGDERFLEPWKGAQSLLPRATETIRVSDAAAVGFRESQQLQEALARWQEWSKMAVQQRSGRPETRSPELVGKQKMDEVRDDAFRLFTVLNRERAKRATVLHTLEMVTIGAVILGGLLCTIGAAWWLRGTMRNVQEAYHRSFSSTTRQVEELNVLLRSIGDAVMVTNREARVLFLNPVAEKLTGWSSAEARGRPVGEVFVLFNEETHEPGVNPVERSLREGVIIGLANHTVLRSRDGHEWPIEDSAAPIVGAEGETVGVVLVFHDVTERREQERRLLQSEQRYRSIFNLQFQFMAVLSPEGRILEVNDLPLRVAAVAREQVTGQLLWEAPWWREMPELQRRWPELLADASAHSGPLLQEVEYRDAAGAIRNAEMALTVVKDEGGAVQFFILQASDNTERKRADEAVREAERRFRFLNDLVEGTRHLGSPETILATVTRLVGQHLQVSRCAYADVEADGDHFTILHDYTDGSASTVGQYELDRFGPVAAEKMRTGRTLVVHDVDRELSLEEGGAMFSAIGIKAIVCCPLLKEGQLRAMMAVHQTTARHWSLAEVALVEEVVERSWAYIERVRTETALRGSEERLRLAMEAASMGAWELELPSGRRQWDARCKAFFGLDPEAEVDDDAVAAGVHPPDRPHVRRALQEALRAEGAVHMDFEMRTVSQGRTGPRWLRAVGQSTLGPNGRPDRLIGTLQDITELKRHEENLRAAKEQAESASRAKDNFLAALSHELRTPLTPVLLTAAAMRRRPGLPEEVYADLATVQRNVELEARLIDDLLDLTRMARGKLTVRRQESDLHSLVKLAANIVADEARTKQQTLSLDLAASRTWLDADPARLQQVIWNLLRNAVKFTPAGGTIALATSDADEWLRVAVTDTGVGMDAIALEKIFQPFEQVGYENDHRFGGLGLGLAITRAIVDLHGGRIYAASAGPNQGSTFTVDLPGAHDHPVAAVHERDLAGEATQNPDLVRLEAPAAALRLLVVEDHEPTLTALARLLRREGYAVVTATNVQEALSTASQHSFDGVVSDLGLPDGTGIDLMRQLRSGYELQGIALTGYGMEEDVRRTLEAGFIQHLVKPIDFETLRQALGAFAR